jgi:hypothetical protein
MITPYQAFYHPDAPIYAPISAVLQFVIPAGSQGAYEKDLVYFESEPMQLRQNFDEQSFLLKKSVLFLGGAMLVAFSKEKTEDEFIVNIRLTSLLWALLVNNILLLIAFVFIYGTTFFSVMVYNMFTVLIIFILRFNYLLYKNSKTVIDEK